MHRREYIAVNASNAQQAAWRAGGRLSLSVPLSGPGTRAGPAMWCGASIKYVTGGFALAEEYSAFVVGEFEAVAALDAGEGRLLPLHG